MCISECSAPYHEIVERSEASIARIVVSDAHHSLEDPEVSIRVQIVSEARDAYGEEDERIPIKRQCAAFGPTTDSPADLRGELYRL